MRLVAAVDVSLDAACAVAQMHGGHATTDLQEALALREVDAVLVASPNALHYDHTLAAIRAGKHVLVEKPLAPTGAEARDLAHAARQAGVVLAAGHTYRHGPAFHYLVDHWADFGKLMAVEVTSCVRWNGPQAPGGPSARPPKG